MMKEFVEMRDVRKIYRMGEVEIAAADGIDFQIKKGEFAVVVGPSGAGKTTVLNILGGMDTATSGDVWIDGKNIAKYSPRQLTSYRRDDIGFVFQFYNLIPNLTALENVELASAGCGNGFKRSRTGRSYEEFPGTAFRRGAAEGIHCPCAGKESKASFV